MARNSALIAASATIIGFGVPALSIYTAIHYGFNYIAATIISVMALIVSGILLFFGIVVGPLGHEEGVSTSERRRLEMFRAHLRATLEEMDDIIELLGEIRDLLKGLE
jgi:hypothetical protein